MLSVYKKNTIFGRNINSNLPLYYDNIVVEGETTQETRSGKNLFNINATYRANNATVTRNETGFNAVATGGISRVVFPVSVINGQSYTISFDYASSGETIEPYARLRKLNNSGDWISSPVGPFTVGHNSFTLTATSTGDYFIWFYFNSSSTAINYNVTLTNIQFEEGSIETSYEKFGVQPSPDYPSDIVSVGYENLLEPLFENRSSDGITISYTKNGWLINGTPTSNVSFDIFNKTLPSGKYIINGIEGAANNTYQLVIYKAGTIIKYLTTENYTFTLTEETTIRLRLYLYQNYGTFDNLLLPYQLEKGTQARSFIPYGKYGLEVKTTGKNLSPTNSFTLTKGTNRTLNIYFDNPLPAGNYTISCKITNQNGLTTSLGFYIQMYDTTTTPATSRGYFQTIYSNTTSSYNSTRTTAGQFNRLYVFLSNSLDDSATITIDKFMLEKGTQATPYEPYIGHTNLITLNEPLRAIGNYKDKLYIDNGMLYVERKIGSVVLNGTEIWETASSSYYTSILKNVIADTPVTTKKLGYSNYFEVAGFNYRNDNNLWFHSNKNLQIKNTNYPNLNDWKTWLSTHNTEVNYILAKSIIESYELDVQPMIFESLGYGILSDVVSDSLITEELNGSYILEFEYMKNGKFSEFLVEENIIKAHGEPFSIYSVKKDTDERIKILAKHWVLNEWNKDFILDSAPTDLVAQSALNWIQERSINHSNILITGDCDSIASARYVRKNMIDAIFKEDNSILNRFGGELSYNKNNVTINKHRGNSAGITIRQGKNITGAEYYLDFSTVTTRLVPVGKDGLMLNDIYVDSPLIDKYATPIIRKVDVDTDSTEELENYCNQLFESGIDKPTVSIKIDFIELSKTTEYKNYSSLETAHLGDTVIAYIPSLNLNISTRVVKVVYNDNLQRITSLELGSITQNIATSNVNFERKMQKQIDLLVASDSSVLEEAKQNATDLINHPFGGHIYIDENSGNMYIMDTTDINTAQNIWRWGLGGLGFSSTGINGPYGVAMTQDGKIVADYITAGVLSANVISSMNLNLTSKNISISSTNFTVSPDGTINAKNGKFSGSVEIEGDKPNYSNDDDADLYVHYHELEEDVEGFDGTGEIETTNESKVFSNGVFLQSKYNNSVPGSTSNTNGLDRVSQLNIDSYSSYEPVVIRRFFRDSNDNISGESNSIMKYGGFEAHDAATGDFSVIGSEMVLTDPNNKSITISPNSIPTPVLSNWYSTTATTLTGAKNHKLLVILARPGSSSAIMSLIIPTDCLTTSNQEFQVADESNYVSFNIKYSGSNILISGASRSNYGSIISAWTML